MYPSLTKSQSMRAKRKSAVELLAESKPFYVKSEIVRDTTQQLPARPHSNFGGYGTYNRSKSVNVTTSGAFSYGRAVNFPQCKYFDCYNVYLSFHLPKFVHYGLVFKYITYCVDF